jgi:protein-tyrosine kinase
MASLIEQAAARLEQLRRAGVALPDSTPQSGTGPGGAPVPPTPTASDPASRPAMTAAAPPPTLKVATNSRSKQVELDFAALSAMGLLTPGAPRSRVADQYRVIKRPLIKNAVGKGATTLNHANLIMVTSALAGEGKSFTSLNLAMSMATELDHTVMLVDADVARPSLLRMLGLQPGPGLLDVLEGQLDLSEVLLRTNIDKLTLLPSGTPQPRATELLASESMRNLLDDMANRYPDRIILFDSPPLLLTTESRVLASHMGQIVIVVHAEHTPQAAVQQALATIESCPVKMMLLNQSRGDESGSYGYGYGDGYGYGYGYTGMATRRPMRVRTESLAWLCVMAGVAPAWGQGSPANLLRARFGATVLVSDNLGPTATGAADRGAVLTFTPGVSLRAVAAHRRKLTVDYGLSLLVPWRVADQPEQMQHSLNSRAGSKTRFQRLGRSTPRRASASKRCRLSACSAPAARAASHGRAPRTSASCLSASLSPKWNTRVAGLALLQASHQWTEHQHAQQHAG